MQALLQGVSEASVMFVGKPISQINHAYLRFMCTMMVDSAKEAEQPPIKTSKLRIFKGHTGKIEPSLIDTDGEVLVISQFTLAGNITRGN